MKATLDYQGISPRLGARVFIADSARVVGNVTLEDDVSIWFGAVLRGDVGSIQIGARSNIQDLCCLHMSGGVSNTRIGAEVTVGHSVVIHGATVGDGALVGMGSVLMDNAEIGEEALIAAGTLVTPNTKVPPRVLFVGRPGRVARPLRPEEIAQGRLGAAEYVRLASRYREPG
jgi:carbonic anhydrase/acetyltransferase-like protein (isoleucine patch superfamily)